MIGLYIVLLIIGLVLFLLIQLYLQNKRLKKEFNSIKNELKFVRGIFNEYTKKYGKELFEEYTKDLMRRAGITDETPLKVKMNKMEWEEYEKENNKK